MAYTVADRRQPTAAPSLLLALAAQWFAVGAQAAPLTAVEVLQQFNLVAFGDVASSSHVDGRVYIGGNASGGDYVQHPADVPGSAYAGVTVSGNATGMHVNGLGIVTGGRLAEAAVNAGLAVVGDDASNVNFNGGPAYVAGTASGTNFNQGRVMDLDSAPALRQAADAAVSTDMRAVMTDFSDQLRRLGSTGSSVAVSGGRATFDAVAGADGVAVFDLTGIDATLFALGEFDFRLNGATTLVFNTDESGYVIAANFLGGSARTIAPFAIWNFYAATSLDLGAEFDAARACSHSGDTRRLNKIRP